MRTTFLRTSFLALVLASLASCGGATAAPASAPPSDESAGDEGTAEPPVPEALAAAALEANEAARAWMRDAAARPIAPTCELAPIYFAWGYEWDEDAAEHRPSIDGELGAEALAVIEWDARCMTARGATSAEITGMVLPRYDAEYAMALGDRLARVVRDALAAHGAADASLTTRSLGNEMATGTDAMGWSRDARVELAPR
jgi:hypothetical protein